MSGLEAVVPFAWGALRLTASLLTAGLKALVGAEDESDALIEWSGDVVLKSRDKSRRTKRQGKADAATALVEQHHRYEVSAPEPGPGIGCFRKLAPYSSDLVLAAGGIVCKIVRHV